MLRQDDYQKSKLVDVMWQYGKEYGGHLASCIIGSCLMNRVRLGWSPNVITAISAMPRFAASLEVPPFEVPAMFDPAFLRLLTEVGSIYEGTRDHAKGATYWCDTRRVETAFFKNKILADPAHKRVLEMNTLACYT